LRRRSVELFIVEPFIGSENVTLIVAPSATLELPAEGFELTTKGRVVSGAPAVENVDEMEAGRRFPARSLISDVTTIV
jgi:hypothetical protein